MIRSLDDDKVGSTEDRLRFNGNDDLDSTSDLNGHGNQVDDDIDQFDLLEADEEIDVEDNIDNDNVNNIMLKAKIEDSNLVDNFWAWALQTESSSRRDIRDRSKSSRPKNPRMQMFAYLSQPSKLFHASSALT